MIPDQELKQKGIDLAKSRTRPAKEYVHHRIKQIAGDIVGETTGPEYRRVFGIIKKGYYSVIFAEKRQNDIRNIQETVVYGHCPDCGETEVRFVDGHGPECNRCGNLDIIITKEEK